MTKPPKKLSPEDIETEPGGWGRFKHAVDAAVKSGPKHRKSSKPHKASGETIPPRLKLGSQQKPPAK